MSDMVDSDIWEAIRALETKLDGIAERLERIEQGLHFSVYRPRDEEQEPYDAGPDMGR